MTNNILRTGVGTISIISGIYLISFHDPITKKFAPILGHSIIGLGTNHWLHFIFGVFFIIGSIYILNKKA